MDDYTSVQPPAALNLYSGSYPAGGGDSQGQEISQVQSLPYQEPSAEGEI